MTEGYLVLESGDIFKGMFVGHHTQSIGEVVFNTSMTGYQEIVSDPSYSGQIMTFCYPLIGNYGINALDNESHHLYLSGVVLSDLCTTPSHYQSVKSFAEHLEQAGVPCLIGVDTRAIVKKIRHKGTMKGVLTASLNTLHHKSFTWPNTDTLSLIEKTSTKQQEVFPGTGPHIVVIDYGHKKSIVEAFIKLGCRVTVVPYSTTASKIETMNPDGVVLSNGPGDPMALAPMFSEIRAIVEQYPTLGICLGHQLVALVFAAKTQKLLFGHRGGNHPVKEIETGKVWMTSQNHSYVVTEKSLDPSIFNVSYRNINDQSIEGLKHRNLPVETVQFHPEARPGPEDTHHIFSAFLTTINQQMGEKTYAVTT